MAWTLREKGTDMELCDKIDQRATDIYTACSFQDITGQRTEKVVKALRFIEQRINAMIEIWGVDDIAFKVDDIASKMQASPTRCATTTVCCTALRQGEGLKQDDVDRMMKGRDARAQAAVSAAAASLRESEGTLRRRPRHRPLERRGFEPPEPLTLAELDAVKRGRCSARSFSLISKS